MSKKNFRIVEEFERTGKGGLYRRGHYDLVVLNPDFIRKFVESEPADWEFKLKKLAKQIEDGEYEKLS